MDARAVSEGKDIEKRSLTVAALIASPASGRGKLKHAPPQHGRCGYQPTGLPWFCSSSHFCSGREVVADGGGVHLARAGDFFQGVLPGTALAHLQHGVQSVAGFLIAVDGAAVQRPGAAGRLRQRAVKLELQNVGQEIAHVRDVGGDVIFGAGIEIRLRCGSTGGAMP